MFTASDFVPKRFSFFSAFTRNFFFGGFFGLSADHRGTVQLDHKIFVRWSLVYGPSPKTLLVQNSWMLSLGFWPQPEEPSQNFFLQPRLIGLLSVVVGRNDNWASSRQERTTQSIFILIPSFFARFISWPAYKRVWYFVSFFLRYIFTHAILVQSWQDIGDCSSSVHQSTALAMQDVPAQRTAAT